jgi:hypothetical protein
MKALSSQITRAFIASLLAGGALPGHAQESDHAMSSTTPLTGFATSQKVKKPSINISLTDSRDSLKASLWANHLLQRSSEAQITPDNLQASNEFEMTGPFLERSAGIRLEFDF